jgi:hypothetical protein
MRETRSSGSVEGVLSDGHLYSDHTLSRQLEVGLGRLAGLLDEAVHDANAVLIDKEQNPCRAVARQVRPHLPEALPQAPAHRHADGPLLLHAQQIGADRLAILRIEVLQPLAHRLMASLAAVEEHGQTAPVAFVRHSPVLLYMRMHVYHIMCTQSRRTSRPRAMNSGGLARSSTGRCSTIM